MKIPKAVSALFLAAAPLLVLAQAARQPVQQPAQLPADKALTVFRGAKWDTPKAEVLKAEGRVPIYDKVSQGLNSVVFEDKILDMDVQVVYSFSEGKLVRGGYVFLADHPDRGLYIQDYQNVREALKKRFGEPLEKEDKSWSGEVRKDAQKDLGAALAAGQLSFMTDWETQDTEIVLSLAGGKRIALGLVYISKRYEKLQQDQQRQEGKKP